MALDSPSGQPYHRVAACYPWRMAEPETTGEEQGRDPAGRFLPGRSGNPTGRPRGARNRSTLAAAALLDGEAEKLTRKAVDLALDGDVGALRLCLERILPRRQDAPVVLAVDVERIRTPADAAAVAAAALEAVAAGELTPREGLAVARVAETCRRTLDAGGSARLTASSRRIILDLEALGDVESLQRIEDGASAMAVWVDRPATATPADARELAEVGRIALEHGVGGEMAAAIREIAGPEVAEAVAAIFEAAPGDGGNGRLPGADGARRRLAEAIDRRGRAGELSDGGNGRPATG